MLTAALFRIAGVLLAAALMSVPSLFAPGLSAAEGLPTVAVTAPEVGERVSRFARRYLDLERLRAELESSLRDTRKLHVLEAYRGASTDLGRQRPPSGTDLADGEAAAGGGSDARYLLVPKVKAFKFSRLAQALPHFDSKYRRHDAGMIQLSAQMVDAASGRIEATFELASSFATKPRVVSTKAGSPDSAHFTRMAKDVGTQLADQFVAAVYPMKIVKRSRSNQVIINRGQGDGLDVGETLEVFSTGGELIDPDSGMSLGASEVFVGTIQVVRIDPLVSYAIIVSEVAPGDGSIDTGDIVRRLQEN